MFSDNSDYFITDEQTNAIVIPGQTTSSYNNCIPTTQTPTPTQTSTPTQTPTPTTTTIAPNSNFINFSTFTVVPDSPWFNKPNPYTEMMVEDTETLSARYGIITNPPFTGNISGTLVFSLGTQFNLANLAFNILIYKNGTLINTIPRTTTTTQNFVEVLRITDIAFDSTWLGDYKYKLQSNFALTFSNSQLRTLLYYTNDDPQLEYYQSRYTQTVNQFLN
jgi:hypothetical protein